MKVRRDISSIPFQSAEDTWQAFRGLVTGAGTIDVGQLDAAASVMASLIADEVFQEHPMTMTGVSHRLVVYLRYRGEALETGADIDELSWVPTAGDWRLFVPCQEDQLDWVRKALSTRAPRIVPVKPGDAPADSEERAQKADSVNVNWAVFDR